MVGGLGIGCSDCPTAHYKTRKWCGRGTEGSAGARHLITRPGLVQTARLVKTSKRQLRAGAAVPASRFTKTLAHGIVRGSNFRRPRNSPAMKVAFIKARR
jgi:hypothetical protein